MAGNSIPSQENLILRCFKLSLTLDIGGTIDMGNIQLGEVNIEEEMIPILNGQSNRPNFRKFFTKPPHIECETLDAHPDVFKALIGKAYSNIGAGATTVTDEPIALSGDDKSGAAGWHKLVHGAGHEAPIVMTGIDDAAGASPPFTYVQYTDYVINYETGKVARVATGSIVDGQTVYATYDYVTQTSIKFTFGLTQLNKQGSALLTYTYINGAILTLTLPKMNVTSPFKVPFAVDSEGAHIAIAIDGLEDDSQAVGEKLGWLVKTTV